MSSTRVFTIGFTKKSAAQFFTKLKQAGVKRVVDVRLNNVSQLAGFAKRDDLRYFLQEIGGIDYVHLPILAPTQDMLDEYKKTTGDWNAYERKFLELMETRNVQNAIQPADLDGGCLLCSEHQPHQCHRRLVVEYLQRHWTGIAAEHLV
jgi:uncharacterized protein (DUF488 family)